MMGDTEVMKKFNFLLICVCIILFVGCSNIESVNQMGELEKQNAHPTSSSVDMSADTPDNMNASIHEQYIEEMKKEENNMNYILNNGDFANPYTYYDIDGNGIDELIIFGGYYAYSIYSYQDGKVVGLAWNKYGSNLKIYPDEGVVAWEGGHSDYYYKSHIKISDAKAEVVAEKSWHIELTDHSQKVDELTYNVMDKKVKKKKYKEYISSLSDGEEITHKDLSWHK